MIKENLGIEVYRDPKIRNDEGLRRTSSTFIQVSEAETTRKIISIEGRRSQPGTNAIGHGSVGIVKKLK